MNSKSITTLHDLLDYNAQKFAAAEVVLRNNLPAWINKAGSVKLKLVLQRYLDLVTEHVDKLSSFITAEEINSLSLSNKIMLAFVDETNEKIKDCTNHDVTDACLVSCIQGMNHFKISFYGTAAAFAKELEMERFSKLFHDMEVNEKQIDERLTELAVLGINSEAEVPIVLPQ